MPMSCPKPSNALLCIYNYMLKSETKKCTESTENPQYYIKTATCFGYSGVTSVVHISLPK
jgi:hypothetical protein